MTKQWWNKKPETLRQCPACGNDCCEYKVHKENENHGRPFIACMACGGFFWLDKGTCACGGPLQEWTVKKESPNKGRKFTNCPSCDRFEWLDDPEVKEDQPAEQATVR